MKKKILISLLAFTLVTGFIGCSENKKESGQNEKNSINEEEASTIDENIINKFMSFANLLKEHNTIFAKSLEDGEITGEEIKKSEDSIGNLNKLIGEIKIDNEKIKDEIFNENTKKFIVSMETSNKFFIEALNGEDKFEEAQKFMEEAAVYLNGAINRRNELKKNK